MTYADGNIQDPDIIDETAWVPIQKLRALASIFQLRNFRENVLDIRDKINNIFSSAKSIVSKTTRFPDDEIYCFLNHTSLRDNLAEMLMVAQDNDLYNSYALIERFLKSMNDLSKIVFSLSESTRTASGCYNQKTFESEFQLTWEDDAENEVLPAVKVLPAVNVSQVQADLLHQNLQQNCKTS